MTEPTTDTTTIEPADSFSSVPGSWNTGNISTNKNGIYYCDYRNLDIKQYTDHSIYFSLSWIFTDRALTSFLNNKDLQLAKTLLESLAFEIENRKMGVLQCVCITTAEVIYSFYLKEEYVDKITSLMREIDLRDDYRFEWETALDEQWAMYRYIRTNGYVSFDDFEASEDDSGSNNSIILKRQSSTG